MASPKAFKIIDILSYIFLLANVIVVPLFLDKNLANLYIIPKQYVFIGLVLISVILLCARVVLSRRLEFRRSILDLPIIFLIGVSLLSSVFSVNRYDSFLGRNEYFLINFLFLVFSALFYFLIVNNLHTKARWRGALDALTLVGGLTSVIFILKMIFHLDLLAPLFSASIWNTFDAFNSTFGLWLIVIFSLSAGQIIKKSLSAGRLLFNFFITIICFASLVLLSFKLLWWILLAALIMLLLLGVSFIKDARMGWLSTLFAGLVLVIVLIIFGTPRSLQSSVPSEVSLGLGPSWSVATRTVLYSMKNFLIGSGLGSFGVDFSQFRDAGFNYDQNAWLLRFAQPQNTWLAILSEGGVVLFLLWLFLILLVLGHVFVSWVNLRTEGRLHSFLDKTDVAKNDIFVDVFLVVIAWLILSAGMAFLFFGPSLWWLWWLLLGLGMSGLAFLSKKIIKNFELAIENTPQYSLAFSFVLIVIISAMAMLGAWGIRLYVAEIAYAQALKSSDGGKAVELLQKALEQRESVDIYHTSLARIYLQQAVDKSRLSKPNVQEVSALMAQAVNETRRATDLSPRSVAIWEILTTMYENAAVLVPDAREWANKSLLEARTLEPTNPILSWRLGNNYSLAGKWDDAGKQYEEAIRLKKDYMAAYVGQANALEQAGETSKAVDVYRGVFSLGASNPEFLFNFGRLLYNRNGTGDRSDAEKLWLEAVRLQPNYSNALYSLGLYYEFRGDKATALQYYYKVKDLNPDNKDIVAKIKTLIGANR